uniref:LRRK2 ARM repeat domain-containing protein n=1 Tax=Odontella aurita TaxID=265563 RepID=A0A7S4JPJ0_9STRA|mmetsp:Transcript_51207/g.153823  ORF Transcript_51207/g.153823 Transcript_51207/m.153823 type:complete len:1236 (+) Transcript_51207:46-3753(+)
MNRSEGSGSSVPLPAPAMPGLGVAGTPSSVAGSPSPPAMSAKRRCFAESAAFPMHVGCPPDEMEVDTKKKSEMVRRGIHESALEEKARKLHTCGTRALLAGETKDNGKSLDHKKNYPPVQDSEVAELESLVEAIIASGEVNSATEVLMRAIVDNPGCVATQRYCNSELYEMAQRYDRRVIDILSHRRSVEGIIRGAETCEDDAVVQKIVCRLLWLLGVEVGQRAAIVSAGGNTHIVRAMVRHIGEEDVIAAAFGAIKPLSMDFYGRGIEALERKDTARAVAHAMAEHCDNTEIQADGCSVLSNLAVDVKNQQVSITTKEEIMAILKAMSAHQDNRNVQKQACFALKHLSFAARNADALIEADLPTKQLLETAARRFPEDCKKDCKIALRRLAKGSKRTATFSSSTLSSRAEMSASVRPEHVPNSTKSSRSKGRRASSTSPASTTGDYKNTSPSLVSSRSCSSPKDRSLSLPLFPSSGATHRRSPSVGGYNHHYQQQIPSPATHTLETIVEKRNSKTVPPRMQQARQHAPSYRRNRSGHFTSGGSFSTSPTPSLLASSYSGENTGLADELLKNAVRSGRKGEYSSARAQFEIVLKMKISMYGPGVINSDIVNVINCLGYVCAVAGDTSGAVIQYKKSLDMQQQLLNGATPADEDVANTLSSIGVLYMKIRDLKAAEKFLTDAVKVKQSVNGTTSSIGLFLCRELECLGDLEHLKGRLDEAETLYRLAASCYSYPGCSLVDNNTAIPLAGITAKLGVLAGARGDNVAAKRLMEASLDTKRRAYNPVVCNTDLAESLCSLGYVEASSGDGIKATRRYEESLDIQRRLLGDNGRLRNMNLARTLTSLGMLCMKRGQRGAARSYLEEALDVKRFFMGKSEESEEGSCEFLGMLHSLGEACDCDEDSEVYFEEALQHASLLLYYEEAREQASLKSNLNIRMCEIQTMIADLLFRLGCIVMRRGDLEEARKRCDKALNIYLSLREAADWGPDINTKLVSLLNNLGYICAITGDYDSAIDKYDLSFKIQRSSIEPGTFTVEMAHTQNSLGVLYFKKGSHLVAEESLTRALFMKRHVHGSDSWSSPNIADMLRNIGEVCLARMKYDQAEAHFEEAFAIYEAVPDGSEDFKDASAELSDIYSKLGMIAGFRGDIISAKEHIETALEIKRDIYGPDAANHELVGALNSLGYVCAATGNHGMAIRQYEESLEMLQCIYGSDSECKDIIQTAKSINLLRRISYALCAR